MFIEHNGDWLERARVLPLCNNFEKTRIPPFSFKYKSMHYQFNYKYRVVNFLETKKLMHVSKKYIQV